MIFQQAILIGFIGTDCRIEPWSKCGSLLMEMNATVLSLEPRRTPFNLGRPL